MDVLNLLIMLIYNGSFRLLIVYIYYYLITLIEAHHLLNSPAVHPIYPFHWLLLWNRLYFLAGSATHSLSDR